MRLHLLAFLSLPLLASAAGPDQIVLPELTDMAQDSAPFVQSQPRLSDLLTIESSASIFYSYARETKFSALLTDGAAKNTIIVPTNKAVMALARKPHQGPQPADVGLEISEQEYEVRSKQNVERWVSAHIIPQSPISLNDQTYGTLLDGRSVSFKLSGEDLSDSEWRRAILEDHIRIVAMREAGNGVYYLIDGVIGVD